MMHAYESDFAAWADDQAKALAEHRIADLDFEHLEEEIEDLGNSERRALQSSFRRLIQHLLKWKYQADYRLNNQSAYNSWYFSIGNHRALIEVILEKNPSLKPSIEETLLWAYPRARRDAARETKLPEASFPETLEWSFDELLEYRLDP